MRTAKKTVPTLDLFRLAAVLLVVMNHTSPLADVSAMADFWLTRVLARVAVPFFLMTTGYFLSRNHWAGVGRQLKKLCLLYGVCILLYLPVNLYAGSFTGPADVLRKLLVDGTFYHLWYFPATILGIVIARWLSRLGLRVALPVAALLYLIGLGGDSYYGLVSQIPLLRTLYDGIFTLCGYTRNGLFFAPLFLLLGAAGRRWNQKLSLAGFFLSLAAMSAEGLWLPSHGCPAPRQHVPRPPPVHSMPFFSAAGRKQGRVQESPGIFHSHVCAPSPLHRTGPGSGKATGTGRNAH